MLSDAWTIAAETLSGFGILVCLALLWHMRIQRYADNLARRMSWGQWVTIASLAKEGYRPKRCARALIRLHGRGQLEARLDETRTPEERARIQSQWTLGGTFIVSENTAKFCEFSLTHHGEGEGRRIPEVRLPSIGLGSAPMLAPVPVRK
ncbi:MAG: hypothetical protein Q7S95_01685 [bacterium]|nr:hypothetical protein [bacterium]